MYIEHHQDCPFCQIVSERPSYFIEENENYLSMTSISPNSEGHVQIITKEPRTDITELNKEEWDNLLPILKSTINRIENTFHPQGFSLVSSVGKEIRGSRQTVFHFHLHVIPEHKGSCGVSYLRRPYYTPTLQEYQELEKHFQTQQGIIGENNKAVVKLVGREQASDRGHLIINSKKPVKSDINQLDIKTWTQMGELFRKSVKEIQERLAPGSLRACIFLGKIGGLNQEETSELQIHLVPRYKEKGTKSRENIPITKEIIAVTESLKKADNQSKINASGYTNLMLSGGFVMTVLGITTYSWLKRGK